MAIHAGLMLLAWGMLMPLGAILARYWKVAGRQNFPSELDNRFWFDWHRVLQYGGIVLATIALAIIMSETTTGFATTHGRLGLFTMILGWLQVVAAWLRGSRGGPPAECPATPQSSDRRGDHYDMSLRRRLFEAWHKPFGWIALVLAAATILLGLDLVGAPPLLLALIGMMQAAAVLAVADRAWRGRWVGTYRAIWGADPTHPGNSRNDPPP